MVSVELLSRSDEVEESFFGLASFDVLLPSLSFMKLRREVSHMLTSKAYTDEHISAVFGTAGCINRACPRSSLPNHIWQRIGSFGRECHCIKRDISNSR